MSIDRLIRETGAQAAIGDAGIKDVRELCTLLIRYGERIGCEDKISHDYVFKIAAGILGNWEWQCGRIREGKQSGELQKSAVANLWTPK